VITTIDVSILVLSGIQPMLTLSTVNALLIR